MGASGQRKLGSRKAFKADEYVIRALLLILMSKRDDSFNSAQLEAEEEKESEMVATSGAGTALSSAAVMTTSLSITTTAETTNSVDESSNSYGE